MFIGKVAELTGVTRKAIRHYEAIGLIPSPKRRGSYRIYSNHDVSVIRMIRQAQRLGFSLSELKEIVSRKVMDRKLPADLVSTLIDNKRHELEKQAQSLLIQASELQKFKLEVLNNFS